MPESPDVSVVDADERSRFEVIVDGELAGVCEYVLRGDLLNLVHTEVYDGYEGRGLAGRLARTALESARERGLRVRPTCPYIASYLEKHPEYGDLVA